jgi:hypothetical protein
LYATQTDDRHWKPCFRVKDEQNKSLQIKKVADPENAISALLQHRCPEVKPNENIRLEPKISDRYKKLNFSKFFLPAQRGQKKADLNKR